MNITAKTKNGICRLAIEGEMTIYTALDTKPQLLRHLAKLKELEVDLSQVTEIDSAGLQLLCALKREASQAGVKLRIIEHSAAVIDVIDTYQLAGFFGDVFDDFYLEVMSHDEPEINAQCAKVTGELVRLSRDLKLPLVATNDSHYTSQDDAKIHDVLLCIGTNSTVDDPKRQLKMNDTSYYVKSEAEMLALFPEIPEAVTNTQLVADQCDLTMDFGRLHLPEPETPPGRTPHEHLTDLAREGLNRKYPFADERVRDRLCRGVALGMRERAGCDP